MHRIHGRLIVAAASVLLAAARVQAKDALELSPASGRAGVSIVARGAFSANADEVTVHVGGSKVQVFELAVDRLRFIVPVDTKLGPVSVEVTVRGYRSKAVYTVVDEKDPNRDAPGAPAAPPLLRDAKLELAAGRAVVTASTDLPDGFSVAVVLGFAGLAADDKECVLATTKTRARGGELRVELGPFEGEALGRYFAALTFELARQSGADQGRWKGEPSAWTRAFAVAGSEEELAKHVEAVAEHYRALAKKTGDLRASVEKAYAAAVARDAKDARFVRKGAFDAAAWLRFVEEEAWKPLRVLDAEERAFAKRWLGVRRERASVEALAAVREVVRLVQARSKALHEWEKLEVPASIREPADLPRD